MDQPDDRGSQAHQTRTPAIVFAEMSGPASFEHLYFGHARTAASMACWCVSNE
jgi:hypothetical protein